MAIMDSMGRKLMYFDGKLFSIDNNDECGAYIDLIGNFNDDFDSVLFPGYDITSISYLGKVLWKRIEYFTLKDALLNKPHDKCIKHKDCPINGGKVLSVDNFIQVYRAWLCRNGTSTIDASIKALEQINEKVWEYVD